MDIRFDGKIAVVTGAGQGIGRSIAKALARGGAVTHALSKTQANLDKLSQDEPSILTYPVDLTNWNKTREVLKSIGPVDLLVNNAGIFDMVPFLDVTEEQFDRTFNINVKAMLNISQIVAGGMIERSQGGAIVNISSEASQRAFVCNTSYCTSKAAVDMLTKMMALELGPHQIRVNAVNPTVTWTEMAKKAFTDPLMIKSIKQRMPQGKFAEVEDVVRPVLYLLSDKSDMINGATLPVDGGLLAS